MTITPEQRAEQIAKRLHPYCTALLKLFLDENGILRIMQIGSGTFVKVGEAYGILTAHHCADLLSGRYRLGLSVAREGDEHNFNVAPDTLNIIHIAKPLTDELGPDLAFIGIVDWEKISRIMVSKSFYDLLSDRTRMLTEPPEVLTSAWYVCGVPNITFLPTKSEASFDQAFEFQELCGFGGVDQIIENDGYDYSDMYISPGEGDPPPQSFGGMSGGGLWQVPWPPSDGSDESIPEMLLSGVIFYQGTTEDGTRFLRSHFRKSVYHHVIDALIN